MQVVIVGTGLPCTLHTAGTLLSAFPDKSLCRVNTFACTVYVVQNIHTHNTVEGT